jgi:hypothetical protein
MLFEPKGTHGNEADAAKWADVTDLSIVPVLEDAQIGAGSAV